MISFLIAAMLAQAASENVLAFRSVLTDARRGLTADVDQGRGSVVALKIRNQVQNAENVWTVCLRQEADKGRARQEPNVTIVSKGFRVCAPDRVELQNWIILGVRAAGKNVDPMRVDAALSSLDERQRRSMIAYLSR